MIRTRVLLWAFGLAVLGCYMSCKQRSREKPDISAINIHIKIRRFDKDLFALRPDHLTEEVVLLQQKYPKFYKDFMENILGIEVGQFPQQKGGFSVERLRQFLSIYRPVYDSVQRKFVNLPIIEKQFSTAFRYLKFYFPDYPTPQVISFIGPVDAVFVSSFGLTPETLSDSTIGISLLLHMGKDFTVNGQKILQSAQAGYILQKFTPESVVCFAMQNVVEDIFPDSSATSTLIEQMVEKGKRYYLLEKLVPSAPDYVLLGYTQDQELGCRQNEASIWNTLKTLQVLYTRDPSVVRTYIGDAPFTQTISRESPGNIGSWVGLQIVRSYMQHNPSVSVAELMRKAPQTIFLAAKYKPRNKNITK